MPQVVMKLDDKELIALRDKAAEIALSISDFLRKKVGFQPLLRGVGRPGLRIKCPKRGCGMVVTASAFAKHMRSHEVKRNG